MIKTSRLIGDTQPIVADISSLCEKNHQVGMMSIIYGNASRVCIWLGDATASSKVALAFVRDEASHLQDFKELYEHQEKPTHKWLALIDLMSRPWFSRRWVVQEVALARSAMIYCGNDEISWDKFALAVEFIVEMETQTQGLWPVKKSEEQFRYVLSASSNISERGASLLVDVTRRLFRNSAKTATFDTSYPVGSDEDEDYLSTSPESDTQDSLHHPKDHMQPLLSLEFLVSSLTIFDTTVPHDTIYALLAIAKDTTPYAAIASRGAQEGFGFDTPRKAYSVDYRLPYVDVCKDFIQFSIEQARNGNENRALDVICRPWAIEERKLNQNREAKDRQQKKAQSSKREEMKPMERLYTPQANRSHLQSGATRSTDTGSPEGPFDMKVAAVKAAFRCQMKLPSWVPQLSNAPFAMDQRPGISGPKMSRINADPLVGLPSTTHHNYSAAETRGVDMKALRFRKRPATKHFSMYVRGFQFDVIEEVTQEARNGQIPIQWAHIVDWKDAEKLPPDPFWRTLIANRSSDGSVIPLYYPWACRESFRKGTFGSGVIDTRMLIDYEYNSPVAQFCRRAQAVTWNRALVRTESGTIGLVGKDVRKNDLVCILYGCSVPVVLRESPRKSEENFDTEMRKELAEIKDTVVGRSRHYFARKRQHLIRKDKEMARLCRTWLKTTDYIRSHPDLFTSQTPGNIGDFISRILKQMIADFNAWRIQERMKAWVGIKHQIDMEIQDQKENSKEKSKERRKRPGKKEMDEYMRKKAARQETEKQMAEARVLRTRKSLQSITTSEELETTPSVPLATKDSSSSPSIETPVTAKNEESTPSEPLATGDASSSPSIETPVTVKNEKPFFDWWAFEYALVSGRRWKQVVKQRREARDEARRQQLFDEYRTLQGGDVLQKDKRTEKTLATQTIVTERDSAFQEERGETLKEGDRDGPPRDIQTPVKIRPSWRRDLDRTRLNREEAVDYDRKVQENMRERLGEEGYYSYTFLGECYIHGMMDGEAMYYHMEDVEGVMPSMIYELR